MNFRIGFAAAVLAICVGSVLTAQNPTASLVGTVTDASGGAVAAAKVQVRNSQTNETRESSTDMKGEFAVTNLPPGSYDVTVTKEGFQTLRQTGLELQMEQSARLALRLEVGAITQSVDVTASTPLVNTENAVKGEVMVSQEIVEMPLDGRDFSDLAYLTPGVMPQAAGGTGSPFNINGARSDNTNFVVDGFNDQNPRAASIQAAPNLEAMAEFKMQTTGYSAEYGRLAGGVMNMVLKSGTNQLHGVLFEYLRNDIFDARNTFSPEKSPLHRNQFGGMVSGPVVIPRLYNGRDKTFFMFSWESFRQRIEDVQLGIVPTAAQREGDFSALGPIKDPLATGTCSATNRAACFPNNQIPTSRFNSIATAATAFYPLPNRPGQVNNYIAIASDPSGWDSDVIKIDHRFSEKDTLSGRWLKPHSHNTYPYGGGSNLGTFGYIQDNPQTLTGLTYTHLFAPTLIDEARIGFTRTYVGQLGFHSGTNYNAQLGLPGPTDPKLIGFPKIVVSGYEQLGDNSALPVQFTINNFQYTDTLTWVKGTHIFKFGFDWLHTQYYQPYFNNNRGTFNFNGKWTNDAYTDLLLGVLNSASHQVGTEPNYLYLNNRSSFAQDDWRIASRLTLSLGMRYELPTPPAEKYGRWTNFIPELGKLVLSDDKTLQGTNVSFTNPGAVATAAQLGLPRSLIYTRYDDIGPRIGFAWRPFGGNKSVVRGGYGIFYGTNLWNPVRQQLANVFPFTISQTFNKQSSNPNYLTLSNPFPAAASLTGSVNNVNGIELHAKTPSQQGWNFTIEREIGMQSAIEIGYVGSKGSHLGQSYDLNQPFASAAGLVYPYPAFGSMSYFGFNANSTYNAGTVTLRRRFANAFFYRVSYNYGKSIDDASQISCCASGDVPEENSRNLKQERGRSAWDIGHSFTMAFSYTMPRTGNILLRGWQIAGTGRAQTGQPFSPWITGANISLGEAALPDRIAKGTLANPTPERWFDSLAFPVVPDGSFRFGSSGRNILDGPGLIAINTAFSRNFSVRDRARLQFRWEAFNIVNHPNYGIPNSDVNGADCGTITTAGNPRTMQFALRLSF